MPSVHQTKTAPHPSTSLIWDSNLTGLDAGGTPVTGFFRALYASDFAGSDQSGIPINVTGAITTSPKQYTNQSNYTPSGSNGTIFTLNQNQWGFIRNLTTGDMLFWKRGTSCNSGSFSDVLYPGQTVNDGRGGFVVIDDFAGAISVSGNNPNYMAYILS